MKIFRLSEYKALAYRILLAYFFYFLARVYFLLFNNDILGVESIAVFFELSFNGLMFDTTAILYVNLLFILLSISPLFINTEAKYQKVLFYVYFVFNLLAYSTNFVDFIYYRYINSRTTASVAEVLENESEVGFMFFRFLHTYWYVLLLFIVTSFLWIFLYKKVKVAPEKVNHKLKYVAFSLVNLVVVIILTIGGIRSDFKSSTRPINLVDANRYVKKVEYADLVLNTPFAIIRTIGIDAFVKRNYEIDPAILSEKVKPIKQYGGDAIAQKPNIVLIIAESFGREYLGAFNTHTTIENFVSYTPFLDSLAKHSLIFPNAFANGYKSIHGMSSVIAGIPSFKDAFTSSPYANQRIESLVSILNDLGYDTSFFHGAPNGSMGFLGFSNILGFDHYYGKTEYNNDADFDGNWGIWDEPFLQFTKEVLDKKSPPFFANIFTVTSHEPYVIPKKYEGKFPKGTVKIHECVGYTDYAFKRFFETAQKSDWFQNTLFIITADHSNLKAYDEYKTMINSTAVPILFYMPGDKLKGVDNKVAQQIDIYPTIVDLIGYDKPFRSWGRSLLDSADTLRPFAVNYSRNQYHFITGEYIGVSDGNKITGYYDFKDTSLSNNLIAKKSQEMDVVGETLKAFLKDYYDRIIERKLGGEVLEFK